MARARRVIKPASASDPRAAQLKQTLLKKRHGLRRLFLFLAKTKSGRVRGVDLAESLLTMGMSQV